MVVVVGPGEVGLASTLDSLQALDENTTEIVIVANGRATDSFDLTRWPDARLVSLDHAVPFGAAANLGASLAVGGALCFLTPGVAVSDGWLGALVSTVEQDSVACAVPLVSDSAGRVLEAGWALDRNGAVGALGGGGRPGSFEHPFRRRTDGGSRSCICVRRSVFSDVGGFDPGLEDRLVAGTDLCRTLDACGFDTVFEPSSRITLTASMGGTPTGVAPGSPGARILRDRWASSVPARRPSSRGAGASDRTPAWRDADCRNRILVVTGTVPFRSHSHAERRQAQLLTDLAALVPDCRLTLLALDGHDAALGAARLLSQGTEVVVGPEDWDEWFARRALLFTHIVLTDLPGIRRLDRVLGETQPQALRVLALPSLAFRNIALSASGRRDDTDGVDLLIQRVHGQIERAARRADAVWCATAEDRAWFASAVPDLRCAVLPTAAAPTTDATFEQRTGYVVLASPGADIAAGHEDAALYAARVLLPILLARDASAFLRVVVDDPSPTLQLLAGPHIELVPAGRDPARWFRRSRVCLACYPRGAGSSDAVTLAIDAHTPLVTTERVMRGLGLSHQPSFAGRDEATLQALRAEELHDQPRPWYETHDALVRVAQGTCSSASARLRLVRACADVGLAPRRDAALDEPLAVVEAEEEAGVRPRNVAVVGSAWKAAPPADHAPTDPIEPSLEPNDPEDAVHEQYRRWLARYGPTPVRLARLARRLAGLVRRPTISIVMPVYNTDPSWLNDAIASVQSQVYPEWELCIGDDGSDRPETIEVLEAAIGEDPRIRLARLPWQQGISAASNAALALATGQFAGFLDHDDELKPHALGEIAVALDEQPGLDLIYTDEDKRDPDGRLVDPFFKPDWSPDHLMSRNYVCHLLVLRRTLIEKLGGFRSDYDGSQDYDLVLRASERTDRIAHVHEPLYTWRKAPGFTASVADAKPWALDAARRALQDALDRRGTPGDVVGGMHPTTYRARYALRCRQKVSILIPTRDRVDLLRNCIDSILKRSTYPSYEITVIDNHSSDPATLAYLSEFPGRVLSYPHHFNYARMMNLAAHEADGDMLLFLNNDTQVISPDWLEALVEHAQRPEVGIVGPRLLYPNGRPQHEGTIIGHTGGHAGNVDHGGYWGLGDIVRNCSAVTGACLMIRPSVYAGLGGQEERLRIAWNDVDLCLRARQAGYRVVYTPYAELFHVEGGTRGRHAHVDDDDFFEGRWVTRQCLDAYYNANLERLDPFRIRS